MNEWLKWNFKELSSIESNNSIITKKFKIFIILFIIILLTIINLRIIEVMSIADGKIIPQGRIKYVQHLEGGIVEEILIKEGEKVELSQPLVVLSKEKASSEFEEINTRLKSLDLSILRVNSEKKSLNEISFPDNNKSNFDKDSIRFENELLKSRKNSINSERKAKKSNIKKANKNLENLKKRLKIVKEQETISQKLLEAEATNRLRHLEILRELSEVKSNIDEQQSIIDISKNDLEQLNFSYNEQLNNELFDLKKQKAEIKKRIQKFSESHDRTILKSPVSGIVKLISVNSKGAIVAPGVTVVEIVPEDEKLIVRISVNDKEEGYYLVKVETLENSFNKKNENFKLYSGVPVLVGIITGKRSFIDYFTTPFRNKITFALSER